MNPFQTPPVYPVEFLQAYQENPNFPGCKKNISQGLSGHPSPISKTTTLVI